MLVGAAARQPHALVYPEPLRFLAAHCLGLSRTPAFRGGGRDVPADERAAAMHALMEAPAEAALRLAYPDVFMLHEPGGGWGEPRKAPQTPPAPSADGSPPPPPPPVIEVDGEGAGVVLPPTVPATLAYMHETGVYLISSGAVFVLWIGRRADPNLVAQLLGPEAAAPNADVGSIALEPPRQGAALSARLCALLGALRGARAAGAPAFAVRQGTPAEAAVAPLLVEDRAAGQPSYADFLVALHRQVVSNK